jgi:2-desacetyl-2-hydroxyethyl bacteriochlorophyllide A dehydrogenase
MPANHSRVAPGESRACWVEAPGRAGLRRAALAAPGPAEVLVRALHSGISRGTELLVYRGEVPESEYERMRAPFQEGSFPAPLKYGYASVGIVEQGPPALLGRTVFCLYPHQTRYVVPAEAVHPLPDGLPPARAVLAANMETAVNALWDAAPRVGDRIAVVGAGVVGLLAAWLAGRMPGCEVEVIDTNPERRAVAERLGLVFASPQRARPDADLVIHASGNAEGLATALRLAAFEATVLEMSWYGRQAITLPLGEAFHSRRLTLKSSQVGQVAPSQRARWSHGRRLALALALLRDPALDALVTDAAPFDELPAVLERLAAGAPQTLCHRIDYP